MKTSIPGALALALMVAAPVAHADTAIGRIQVAAVTDYDLLGFKLGMTPDDALAVAKAKSWTTRVKQSPGKAGGSFVDTIDVDAPYRMTIVFSFVTGKAINLTAWGKQELSTRTGPLYDAAHAKFGEPDPAGDDEIKNGRVTWGGRQNPIAVYSKGSWDGSTGSSISLTDRAAEDESFAARKAQDKPTGPAL